MRKYPLVTNEFYHIVNRSIAKFKVFNNDNDYQRMINLIYYYQNGKTAISYSRYIQLPDNLQKTILKNLRKNKQDQIVRIVAYCLMPTHIHLLLQQKQDNGIQWYMSNILNGYSRFFNIAHKRKGPLWESRFKNILVDNDSQLLHLTRYIHLNPSSANITKKPEDWKWSSYDEYLTRKDSVNSISNHYDIINLKPGEYRHFVEDRIHYQKQLSEIKYLTLENYTG